MRTLSTVAAQHALPFIVQGDEESVQSYSEQRVLTGIR
jgi:hypothetical protein